MSVAEGRAMFTDRATDATPSDALAVGALMVKAERGDLEAKAELKRLRPDLSPSDKRTGEDY